jgi:hypothetical protein
MGRPKRDRALRAACALSVVCAVGCGRVGFDDGLDAGAGKSDSGTRPRDTGSPRITPSVMQTATTSSPSTVALAVTTAPTGSGHLLVMVTDSWNDPQPAAAISDDAGNVYVSANATGGDGDDYIELWYAVDSKSGATVITIEQTVASTRDAWWLEAAGIATSAPVDVLATVNNGPQSSTATSPAVTPTVFPALVVTGTAIVGDAVTLASTDYTGLTVIDGNDAAYAVVTAPIAGATWNDDTPSAFCATTVAFKPAP